VRTSLERASAKNARNAIRKTSASYSQRGHADFDGYRAVLRGQADAMIDPGIAPWDVCAVAVLIREAGGTFSALDGNPTIYGPGAIASNGHVHDQVCAVLAARQ
jgi:histidinol-phosphatase